MLRSVLTVLMVLTVSGCQATPQVTEFDLDNGLHVILQPLPTAKTTALVVVYDFGNRHDPAGQSGMAHMAEHLYVTAATENTAARNVQEYVTHYPDGWNAQTGDEYTVIATVFQPERLSDEFSDAADRMRGINVAQSDLDRELPRIESELDNMYDRVPTLAVRNHGRDHVKPLAHGGRRGGHIEQLREVTVEQIQSWLDRHYKPGNAVLVLAGPFDPELAREQIEEQFANIPAGEAPAINELAPRDESRTVELAIHKRHATTPDQVGFAFEAPDPGDPLYAAFQVHAARLMVAAMGWARQRENLQDVPFTYMTLDDPDFLYASMPIDEDSTPEDSLETLEVLLNRQLSEEFTEGHRTRVRAVLARFLGTQELPDRMLAFNPYGTAFALGRRHQLGIDPAAMTAALDAVDVEQLQQASDRFFAPAKRVTVFALAVPE
ncbi:MAG: M16 family metallopeptidase [Pirellulaceae bacterium]